MTGVLNNKKIRMIVLCAVMVMSVLALTVSASTKVNYSFSLTKGAGEQYQTGLAKTDSGPANIHLDSLGDGRFIEGSDVFSFHMDNSSYGQIGTTRTLTNASSTNGYYTFQYYSGEAYPRTTILAAKYDDSGKYGWGVAQGWVNP